MSTNIIDPTVVIMTTIVVTLVGTSITVYWIIQFKKKSRLLMIQKRYPRILVLSGFFSIAWFLIGFPFMICDFAGYPWETSSPKHEVIDRITFILTPSVVMPIFTLIAWRFWLMYYDLMKSFTAQETDQWKIHLDPEMQQQHKSDHTLFWLKHLKTIGSKQWTKKIVIIYNIVSVSIIIVLYQHYINTKYIAHYSSILLHSTPIIFAIVLAYKVPHFADHFFVKYEMKLILYSLVFLLIFSSIAILCFIIFESHWFMISIAIMGPTTFFIIDFISFYWIPLKVCSEEVKLKAFQENVAAKEKKDKEKEKGDESNIGGRRASIRRGSVTGSEIILPTQDDVDDFVRRMSNADKVRRMSECGSSEPYQVKRSSSLANSSKPSLLNLMSNVAEEGGKTVDIAMDLPGILHDDAAFNIFMKHLAKDFSTEYLLCFIEIMQYKFLMKQRFDIIDPSAIDTDINFDISYPLHGIAPLSEINKMGFELDLSKYHLNDDPSQLITECKMVCFKIFKKYIETGAELKIKILESTKKYLVDLMKKESFWISVNSNPRDLFRLYDETMGEVICVLNAFPAYQSACNALKQ